MTLIILDRCEFFVLKFSLYLCIKIGHPRIAIASKTMIFDLPFLYLKILEKEEKN